MMEKIKNEKMISDADLNNIVGGRQGSTSRNVGKATKICHACQLRVDATHTKCPYCGGKLSVE